VCLQLFGSSETCTPRFAAKTLPGTRSNAYELRNSGFEQNVFRAVFQNLRANDLGRKPECPGSCREETILRALTLMRPQFPSFELDIRWLRLQGLRSTPV